MATTNEHTGDSLITKVPTDAYRDGWDNIFKPKKEEAPVSETKKLVSSQMHDTCFECGSVPHKLDCSSKAVFDAYILLRDTDKWKHFTNSMLDALDFKVWVERNDRKFSEMFDRVDK